MNKNYECEEREKNKKALVVEPNARVRIFDNDKDYQLFVIEMESGAISTTNPSSRTQGVHYVASKTQLLAQRVKLKELFDSVLAKSMAGEFEKSI